MQKASNLSVQTIPDFFSLKVNTLLPLPMFIKWYSLQRVIDKLHRKQCTIFFVFLRNKVTESFYIGFEPYI